MGGAQSDHRTQVAIVEDHTAFAQTLSNAIGATHDLAVCAMAQDLDDAISVIEQTCPDILLVDLGLPGGSGLALIHHTRRRWRDSCACAVLTITGNEAHLHKAISAGARGYLFKSDDAAVWLQALHTLVGGGGLLHPGLARHLISSQGKHPDSTTQAIVEHIAIGYRYHEIAHRLGIDTLKDVALHVDCYYAWVRNNSPHLSERESQLLELLNQGLSFKQSAQSMGIQESTVKTLAMRAYQKLGARNLTEALYAARREYLLR